LAQAILAPRLFEAQWNSEAMGRYLDTVQPEWRVHVLFATFLAMIGMGQLAKHSGLMGTASVEGLRTFVFNIALPSLLFVSTWRIRVTHELLIGIPWCVLLHCLWAVLAYAVHVKQDAQKRAWFVLTAQGCFLGYVYPLVASAPPEVAALIVGPALIWDIGGNMWMCLVWQDFIVGRLARNALVHCPTSALSPTAIGADEENTAIAIQLKDQAGVAHEAGHPVHRDPSGRKDGSEQLHLGPCVRNDKTNPKTRGRSNTFPGDIRTEEAIKRHMKTNGIRLEEVEVQILEWLPQQRQSEPPQENGLLSDENKVALCVDEGIVTRKCRLAAQVVAQSVARPIPAAALSGLLLSSLGVPLHPWLEGFIGTYAAAFTPLMFFIMGCFLRLDPRQMSVDVLVANGIRTGICLIMMLVITILPISRHTRFTWTLSVWSPMTSFTLVLSTKYNFDEALTVCSMLFSQVLSFFAMWLTTIVAGDGII